ncbi:hypothetical protein [Streptomyces resistomycificus]|uniref:Uncharacterized protein n=1 Tax=Streptomyces resistomycificus TaxID=67356 RepID=A0A0L8KW36_9ACTN|nr:hypothetical protein [Streptomyces resistomycificus]KOG30090.1 hypothetical protein ADK37_35530 [Streptomyces resistomycificus]KUN98157.1 hypothetical protein AQJ84_15800 [Streptomyces resistomycificus]
MRNRDRVADVTGVVSAGQYPAISGEDLAEVFSTRLGRTVTYEATDPHARDSGAAVLPAVHRATGPVRSPA